MLVYLRLSNVPEQQVEELLLEILDHLIEAQQKIKMLMTFLVMTYNLIVMNSYRLCGSNNVRKTSLIGFVISLLLAIQFGIDTIASLFILFLKRTPK